MHSSGGALSLGDCIGGAAPVCRNTARPLAGSTFSPLSCFTASSALAGEFAQKQIQVAVLVEIDEGGAEADGREFV